MFEEAKVGELVVYVSGYGTQAVLAKIEKASKQHIQVVGQKFRRSPSKAPLTWFR